MAAATIADQAIEAWTAGYAAIDDPDTLPLTPAARIGLTATVEAYQGPGDTRAVFEQATVTAARTVLHRARLRLYTKHRAPIIAAARLALARLDLARLASDQLTLAAAGAGRRARANTAYVALTVTAATSSATPGWDQANAEAWQAATTRGYAEAAARPRPGATPDPKTVTAGLTAAAAAVAALTPATTGWVDAQLRRQAWDISGQQTTTDIEASLTTLDAVGDQAEDGMHQALGTGFVRYVDASGLDLLYWQTEEDSKVCPACYGNEDASPYIVGSDSIPDMPAHPNCLPGWSRVVVPGQESHGHSLDAAEGVAALSGDARSLPAATLAEAERDFGRANIRAVTDRQYVGDLVEIELTSGHKLAGTPNHPIATPGGWVPLAELVVGNDVLHSTSPEWVAAIVDPDVDDIPPTIEQVAQSFPMALRPVPTAAEDFHGDGAGSDVHVVRTDRLLLDHLKTPVQQKSDELGFGRRYVPQGAFHGAGSSNEISTAALRSAHSIVSGGSEPLPLLRGGIRHPDSHGGSSSSGLNPSADEDAADQLPADAEGFCERLLALSPEITAHQIIRISRFPVATHVYNLDTIRGWFISNGIVTHNCRCNWA